MVANVVPTQSSSYALPDYSPIARGMMMLGQGLARGIEGAGARRREEEDEARLANFMAMTGPEAVATMGAQGGAMGGLTPERRRQAIELAGRIRDPRRRNFALTALKLMETETPETFETVHDPYGRGGVGQRSSKTGQIVGYQGPVAAKAPGAATNYYDPVSRKAKAVRAGSEEETALLGAGWLKGDLPDAAPAGASFDDEHKFTTKWTRDSGTFVKLQDSYRGMVLAREQRSATGDMALTYGLLKMFDPTSTVLPGEYAGAENTTGVGGAILRAYNKAVKGEKLTEEQREQFLRTARDRYLGAAGQQERFRSQVLANAERYRIDPRAVLQYIDTDLLNAARNPPALSATPPPGQEQPAVPAAASAPPAGGDMDLSGLKNEAAMLFAPPATPTTPAGGAQAATMDPRYMTGVGTESAPPVQLNAAEIGGYADRLFSGEITVGDLSGLGLEARNAIRAELVRRAK